MTDKAVANEEVPLESSPPERDAASEVPMDSTVQAIMVPLGDSSDQDNSTVTGALSVDEEGIAAPVSLRSKRTRRKGRKDGEEQSTTRAKRNVLLFLLVLMIAITAASVAAFVVISKNGESSDASKSQQGDGSAETTQKPDAPAPTPSPVVPVTGPPTQAPVTSAPQNPTANPTQATMSPTVDPAKQVLVDFFSNVSGATAFSDATSAQSRAVDWLVKNSDIETLQQPALIEQRYALVVMQMALGGDFALPAGVDECRWAGVTCENQKVVSINFARSNLNGFIPDEISLLSELVALDLGENAIGGEIPESLYSLTKLQKIYMHQNKLTGEISESIGNLFSLTHLYLGMNQLSGPFPTSLGSVNGQGHPLRYLVLNHNNLTGSLPSNLRWRAMFYLDLSHNKFSGPLPEDFGGRMTGARLMYLNNNEFSGDIPIGLATMAGARLEVLHLNDNEFTGQAPPANINTLSMTFQNNKFDELGKNVCKMQVLADEGEMINLKADCAICTCKYSCEDCSPNRPNLGRNIFKRFP